MTRSWRNLAGLSRCGSSQSLVGLCPGRLRSPELTTCWEGEANTGVVLSNAGKYGIHNLRWSCCDNGAGVGLGSTEVVGENFKDSGRSGWSESEIHM